MKTRIVSAIIIAIVFIPLLLLGGIPYCVLGGILGLMALWEIFSLDKRVPLFIKVISCFLCLFLILYNYRDKEFIQILDYRIIGGLFLFYTMSIVIIGSLNKYNYRDALWVMIMTILIGFLFNNFIHIRNLGLYVVIYVVLISTVTDTFALIFGRLLGKHKLSPSISPGKTIEGSIGGSIFGTVISVLFYIFFIDKNVNIFSLLLVTLALTLLGQLGDLFFSSIKRYHGVKDFSKIIPGHGGILDRLDSLLFVIFGYLLFITLI